MPFSNTATTVKIVDKQTEKQNLLNEIKRLGIKIEEAQNLLETYKVTKKDISSVKKNLLELNKKLKSKTDKLKEYDEKIKEKEKRLEEIIATIVDNETKNKVIKKKQIEQLKEKQKIENLISLLIGKINNLKMNLRKLNVSKKSLDKLNREIDEKKENQKKLVKKIQKLNKEITDVNLKKNKLEIESGLKSQEIEGKKIEILNLEEKIIILKTKQKEIENNYKEKKEELKKELQEIENNKKEEWEKREGKISLQKKWIEDKKIELRDIKTKIEKKLNREINIII